MGSVEKRLYTASEAFFEALLEAGITHVFVNLGSDHPSILEAIVKARNENKQISRIITCPNEMVALSMADGMARLTGKPQCVLVHVDVGTQGLAAAVHNASTGRAPVLICAGLSPYTIEGEYRGSRTEYIHWIQDVPDQKQILAQYCRYTAEVKRGKNIKQMLNRALQFATSDPQGPVYVYASREAMEEDIEPYKLDQSHWQAVEPAALPVSGVSMIAELLVQAKNPLLIVGYTGRNVEAVTQTVKLTDTIPGLKVLDTGGCDMCFPSNHPAWLGFRYGNHDSIKEADVILVVDCDVPWIPTQCSPRKDAKIVHVDVDVMKQQMPVHYIPAFARFKADSATAFGQLNYQLASEGRLQKILADDEHVAAGEQRQKAWEARRAKHKELAQLPSNPESSPIDASVLGGQLRAKLPEDTIFAVEAVTLTAYIADQLAPVLPKTWINCGGGGLGWSGGAALGIKLATDYAHRDVSSGDRTGAGKGKFVCQVCGDGTFLFSVPSSVYWISQRYTIPVLTIVLSNKGWNAPRRSMLLVHPDGHGSRATNEELNISFEPGPNYPDIAKAAAGGKCWTGIVDTVSELLESLPKAVAAVQSGISAVLEVRINADLSRRGMPTQTELAASAG